MVKLAGNSSDEGAAVYLMPWFFSKRIKSSSVEVIWPADGAIASPVFLLVKKDKIEQHRKLLEFLFSKEVGELLTGRFFPSTHPDVANDYFPEAVKWLGWDFLSKTDLGKIKEEIRTEFMKIWEHKH
jgi:ABC-type Fe3+ transport system substrate-binding protein